MNNSAPSSHEQLLAHLNAETGRLGWPELVRHFARGVVIGVATGLDLVEVAAAMVQDRHEDIEIWTRAGQVWRASDDDARVWHQQDTVFWAVVVAPWVLVQEADDTNDQNQMKEDT